MKRSGDGAEEGPQAEAGVDKRGVAAANVADLFHFCLKNVSP